MSRLIFERMAIVIGWLVAAALLQSVIPGEAYQQEVEKGFILIFLLVVAVAIWNRRHWMN